MRSLAALTVLLTATLSAPALAEESPWSAYLDYAYVFSSADADALRARLAQYGQETGIRLEDYVPKAFAAGTENVADPESFRRREAIAHLLLYLSSGEPEELDRSVEAVSTLKDRLERHENRYWYHYILAHRALERDQRFDFVGELLDLWLHVIVPLETPYDTLRTLSLSDSPNSGFVAALPYLYENLARLILIRSQEMGVDRDLDPLAALVRLLYDGRIGGHPDVIPVELSSRAYLERIVARLDGPESDAGSLTFTLALFEASKYHDAARALLAEQGLSAETVKAVRVSSGAYEAALDRARTLQGQCAVYTRVLRQLGEIYAAKQRLGVDPDVEMPFTIEGAIQVYANLRKEGDDLDYVGYRTRDDYVAALHGLWEEIQETSLNAADYYLTRAVEHPHLADDYARSAARIYARYLSFFQRFATPESRDTLPDSAYFAAHEAARGYGDAIITYTRGQRSRAELDQAVRRYAAALHLFPFDRRLWASLSAALAAQGQESDYLELARPIAEAVTRSRHVDSWIQDQEPGAETIATLRRALSDSQVLVYLGFAEESTARELQASLADLRQRRDEVEAELIELTTRRDELGRTAPPASPDPGVGAGAPAGVDALEVEALARRIDESKRLLTRLEKQIEARTNALPLFQATLGTETLVNELRSQRDHPVHTLLRRMYYEGRS